MWELFSIALSMNNMAFGNKWQHHYIYFRFFATGPGPGQYPVYNSSARDIETWFELLAHLPLKIPQVLFPNRLGIAAWGQNPRWLPVAMLKIQIKLTRHRNMCNTSFYGFFSVRRIHLWHCLRDWRSQSHAKCKDQGRKFYEKCTKSQFSQI